MGGLLASGIMPPSLCSVAMGEGPVLISVAQGSGTMPPPPSLRSVVKGEGSVLIPCRTEIIDRSDTESDVRDFSRQLRDRGSSFYLSELL